MTRHRHCEMIKAKADNMELVKFIKVNREWIVDNLGSCHFDDMCEYFLCLPQHKEACLHWLNGGEIEFSSEFSYGWTEYEPIKSWVIGSIFMQDNYQIRIKPQKEKRHIYISTLGATTYAKKTKEEAAREVNIMGGSFDVWKHYEVEIEVEV